MCAEPGLQPPLFSPRAGRAALVVVMEVVMEVVMVVAVVLLPWCLLSEPKIPPCTSGSAAASVLPARCPSGGAAPLCLSVPLMGGEGCVFWSGAAVLSPEQSREGWIGTCLQDHLFGNPSGVQLVGRGGDVVSEETRNGGWSRCVCWTCAGMCRSWWMQVSLVKRS